MIEFLFLIALVVFAFLSVSSDNLRRSVIYLGVFSLIMAFAYLYYNAPDVALAEAAIGVGLSTVMYLVSLKKIRVYGICYVEDGVASFSDKDIHEAAPKIIRPMEAFLEHTEEVEPQVAYTNRALEEVLEEEKHDLVIYRENELIYLYGYKSDTVYQDVVDNLEEVYANAANVRVVFRDEVALDVQNK